MTDDRPIVVPDLIGVFTADSVTASWVDAGF
jgi:hypothetical protein